MLYSVVFGLSCVAFLLCLLLEKRSIFTGLFLNIAFHSGILYLSDFIPQLLILSVLYFFAPLIVSIPLAIKAAVEKHKIGEFNKFHFMAIFVVLSLILLSIVFPTMHMFSKSFVVKTILEILLVLSLTLLIILHSYVVSTFVNGLNLFDKKLDYILVLGARLNPKGEVEDQLKARCDKAISLYMKKPGSKLIMSGSDAHHRLTEAEGMKRYALKCGVAAEDILLEEKARNTSQNILFSLDLMEPDSNFAIVTNNYHLLRAQILARQAKAKSRGYIAETSPSITALSFFEEFLKYLQRNTLIPALILLVFICIYLFAKFIL